MSRLVRLDCDATELPKLAGVLNCSTLLSGLFDLFGRPVEDAGTLMGAWLELLIWTGGKTASQSHHPGRAP